MTKDFGIPRLNSGGMIVSYYCPSKCRHCLYNCNPSRDKTYITPESAQENFSAAKDLGVSAMHIGGGEPMTDPQALGAVLEVAAHAGVTVDYVETNSFWYKDGAQACHTLSQLRQKGLTTLLISISPFHIEYIPFARVSGVIDACRKTGIAVFPWMETFVPDLAQLTPDKPHRFETLLKTFGESYLSDIKSRYWIHMGGRALKAFRSLYPLSGCESVLENADRSCAPELADTSHFHMDHQGNYIPGLCAGLAISIQDLGKPLDPETYPVITTLAGKGIQGLHDLAVSGAGFSGAGKTYINKCDLCNDIRRFLFQKGLNQNELAPSGYYKEKTRHE